MFSRNILGLLLYFLMKLMIHGNYDQLWYHAAPGTHIMCSNCKNQLL